MDQKLVPLEAFGIKLMSIGFLAGADKAMVWRGRVPGLPQGLGKRLPVKSREVIVSNSSATAIIRAPNGITVPLLALLDRRTTVASCRCLLS
jgi:hypothetical protein